MLGVAIVVFSILLSVLYLIVGHWQYLRIEYEAKAYLMDFGYAEAAIIIIFWPVFFILDVIKTDY